MNSGNESKLGIIQGHSKDPVRTQTDTYGNSVNDVWEKGKILDGYVYSVSAPTRQVDVMLSTGTLIHNCVVAANVITSINLGFQSNSLPAVGAGCLVVMGTPCYIVGTFSYKYYPPNAQINTLAGGVREVSPSEDSGVLNGGVELPVGATGSDMLIENSMGLYIGLLNTIATLSAGDAAKVECCLLNSLVRICDQQFIHYHAAGSDEIYDNGRPNSVENYSSYSFEAMGLANKDEPIVDIANDQGLNLSSVDESLAAQGRYRYTQWKGWLGDFVHRFITDPPPAGELARAGKARVWEGSDGTILIQSTQEISIEVVPSIVVPTLLKAWNDPIVDYGEIMANLKTDNLKQWSSDENDLNSIIYQLRSYTRYLTDFYSLARFLQLEQTDPLLCSVASEKDAPDVTAGNAEADRASFTTKAKTAYAGIKILQNGDISVVNGTGSSVMMAQHDVILSASGNLRLEAGKDIIMVGTNVVTKAADSVEITAVSGSIVAKARETINVLSELGRIWFKADASPKQNENMKVAEQRDFLDKGVQNLDQPDSEFAIVIEASNGNALFRAGQNLVVSSDYGSVFIQAIRKSIQVVAKLGSIFNKAQRMLSRLTYDFITESAFVKHHGVTEELPPEFSVADNFVVESGSRVSCKDILCDNLLVSTIARSQQEKWTLYSAKTPEERIATNPTLRSLKPAANREQEAIASFSKIYLEKIAWDPAKEDGMVWQYTISNTEGTRVHDSVLTDQWRVTDKEVRDTFVIQWNYASDFVQPSIRTGLSWPWPGKSANAVVFQSQLPPLGKKLDVKYTPSMMATSSSFNTLLPASIYVRNYKTN